MPMTIEVTDLPGRLQELLQIVESGTEVLLRDGDVMAKLTTALFVTDDRMISQYSVPIFWK